MTVPASSKPPASDPTTRPKEPSTAVLSNENDKKKPVTAKKDTTNTKAPTSSSIQPPTDRIVHEPTRTALNKPKAPPTPFKKQPEKPKNTLTDSSVTSKGTTTTTPSTGPTKPKSGTPSQTNTTKPSAAATVSLKPQQQQGKRLAADTFKDKNKTDSCHKQEKPTKKRKLAPPTGGTSTTTTTSSSSMDNTTLRAAPITPHMPLADPMVVQTVHNVVGLLQTYGPLSLDQLEYNLPPIQSPRDSYLSRGRLVLGPHTLPDIMDVLVVTGVVQVVSTQTNKTLYTMLNGIPRADVVLPNDVSAKLQAAILEEESTLRRIAQLQKALVECNTKVLAREELKNILFEYPQVAQDPVHVAALKNMHIDVAAVVFQSTKNSNKTTTNETKQKSGSKSSDKRSCSKKKKAPSASTAGSATTTTLSAATTLSKKEESNTDATSQAPKTPSTIRTKDESSDKVTSQPPRTPQAITKKDESTKTAAAAPTVKAAKET